jgi:hypothetical protein
MDRKPEVVVVPVSDVDRPGTSTRRWAGGSTPTLRRAAAAYGEHEARTGAEDPNWPDWYADSMVRERAGAELPS